MKRFDDILEDINTDFKNDSIPHGRRPLLALSRLAQILGHSIQLRSAESHYVHEWFKQRSKSGATRIGPFFEAAYFFGAEFWPVEIPIIYGAVALKPYEALIDMPDNCIKEILNDKIKNYHYQLFWSDCIDFSYGIHEVLSLNHNPFGIGLLKAGFEELKSATSALLASPLNRRAIISSRMALEMFLKGYLVLTAGLTEEEARKISHNIKSALEKVSTVSGEDIFTKNINILELYPSINDRYSEQNSSESDIALCYNFSLSIGAFVTRALTQRNIRSKITKI